MRISYLPQGIDNFHNQGAINLIVTGKTEETSYEGNVYVISKRQAKRIDNHFCGMSECRCPKGCVLPLDLDGEEFGIPVKWCE